MCAHLKQAHGYRNLVMVGDGATDMEACPPADAFVGFGGNQVKFFKVISRRGILRQLASLSRFGWEAFFTDHRSILHYLGHLAPNVDI